MAPRFRSPGVPFRPGPLGPVGPGGRPGSRTSPLPPGEPARPESAGRSGAAGRGDGTSASGVKRATGRSSLRACLPLPNTRLTSGVAAGPAAVSRSGATGRVATGGGAVTVSSVPGPLGATAEPAAPGGSTTMVLAPAGDET